MDKKKHEDSSTDTTNDTPITETKMFSNMVDDYTADEMIKKIKKSKKVRKVKNNYKNIDVFDNVHDPDADAPADKDTEQEDMSLRENYDPKRYKKYQYVNEPNYKPDENDPYSKPDAEEIAFLKKNQNGNGPFYPDDYEGMEGEVGGNNFDMKKYLTALIEYIYACFYLVNYIIAYTIAALLDNSDLAESEEDAKKIFTDPDLAKTITGISNKQVNKMIQKIHENNPFWYVKNPPEINDILVIMTFLQWFEAVTFGIFATYNWFYLMFYTNEDKERPSMFKFYFSTVMQCAAAGDTVSLSLPPQFWKMVNYVFLPCVFLLEIVQRVTVDIFPKVTGSLVNRSLSFVAVFIILILLFIYTPNFVRVTIIDSVNNNTKNRNVVLITTFIIIICFMLFFGENQCFPILLDKEYTSRDKSNDIDIMGEVKKRVCMHLQQQPLFNLFVISYCF